MEVYDSFEKRASTVRKNVSDDTKDAVIKMLGNEANYHNAVEDFTYMVWMKGDETYSNYIIKNLDGFLLSFVVGMSNVMRPMSKFNLHYSGHTQNV